MEGLEYLHGGCLRDGTPSEKQGKGGDQFIVEDLLDFSNEEEEDDLAGVYGGDVAGDNSTDSSTVTAVDSCSNSVSDPEPHFSGDLAGQTLADASLSGDLCEPYDELAELEWLSNFVEESFSSEDLEKLQLISGLKSTSATSSHTGGDVPAAGDRRISDEPSPQFRPEGPVPAKARSKRSRPAPCNWSSRLLVLSPSPTSSSSDTDFIEPAICRKALKKKDSINATLAPADGRKCLHCATDKTPQWRTGPMGPKTLCNACGVRFKSGRLVPEYRPASSPTFMMSKHSNSHRKVLELRRQKEMMDQPHHHHNQFLNSSMFDGPVQGPAGFDFLIHHHIGPDFRQLI